MLFSPLRKKPKFLSTLLPFLGFSSSNFNSLLNQSPFASQFSSAPLACSFFSVDPHTYLDLFFSKYSQEDQTSYLLDLLFLSILCLHCTPMICVAALSYYIFWYRNCILFIFIQHNSYMQWHAHNGCPINIRLVKLN